VHDEDDFLLSMITCMMRMICFLRYDYVHDEDYFCVKYGYMHDEDDLFLRYDYVHDEYGLFVKI
jgi:hypothetical protein